MIYISHRKGLAGNRLECENRFVLGILLRTPLRPPGLVALWADGPPSGELEGDTHTVESLPDFSCAILVRLING